MKSSQPNRTNQVAQFGEMSLDFKKMELCRGNDPVALTLREFKVLKFLVCRPEVVVSRRRLMVAVWPRKKRSTPRGVDNCIAKLRRKIEPNPKNPIYLWTVQGVGYKFVPRERQNPAPAEFGPSETQVGRTCD